MHYKHDVLIMHALMLIYFCYKRRAIRPQALLTPLAIEENSTRFIARARGGPGAEARDRLSSPRGGCARVIKRHVTTLTSASYCIENSTEFNFCATFSNLLWNAV